MRRKSWLLLALCALSLPTAGCGQEENTVIQTDTAREERFSNYGETSKDASSDRSRGSRSIPDQQ
ncbi:MAG: hypothetical protein ACF8CQ_00335 [Rhodopirellula sp. JB044]|uniref:hypothetical protein n=1 Tax=Rhodopirellula sp. JB044 TaxID=3342844 RepID=UPI00370A4AE6